MAERNERIISDCETCTHQKCCRNYWVPLTPAEAERLPVDWNGWIPNAAVLPRQPNGDCIFLDKRQCSIYEQRPVACREYVCVGDLR